MNVHVGKPIKAQCLENKISNKMNDAIDMHMGGFFEDAQRLYKSVLQLQPEHIAANYNAGVIEIILGRPLESIPFFLSSVEAQPNNARNWLGAIDALVRLKAYDDAKKAIFQSKRYCTDTKIFKKIEQEIDELDLNNSSYLKRNKKSSDEPQQPQDLNQEQLQNLLDLYNLGKFEELIEKSIVLEKEYPNSVILNNILGASYGEIGEFEKAIDCYKQALSSQPDSAETYNNLGNTMKEKGEIAAAINNYKLALNIAPNYACAYYNIGIALVEGGDKTGSIENFKRAISINPNYVEAYSSLGHVLEQKSDFEGALSCYKEVLKFKPDCTTTHFIIGNLYNSLGDNKAALDSYRIVLSASPEHSEAYNNMGVTLQNIGDLSGAINSFKLAIKSRTDYCEAYCNLGAALQKAGYVVSALDKYNHALKIKPNYPEAKYLAASLTGETPLTAPKEYVEKLFNGYAENFEYSLIETLEYDLPKIITELLVENNTNNSLGSVLDLGCGTGLFGHQVSKFCNFLAGIDISESMLEKATQKKVYNNLHHDEITQHLSEAVLDYQYFVAADVFIYVGDLFTVFKEIKMRNKGAGKLAFSTEHSYGDGFFLERSGRYSHSESYIRSLCLKLGYELSHFSKINLRKENGKFLEGGVYILDF